jgi:glutamate racemase
MDTRPIGMFDSGIGGLTVAREVFRILPHESVIYLGDTARYPYGPRSKENIQFMACQITEFLLQHDIKFLLVACNTASASALELLQERFKEIEVMGVIDPGSCAAVLQSANGRIGIIGTESTIASKSYEKIIHNIDPDVTVITKACPLFVPLAEEGWGNDQITKMVVERYLAFFRKENIDVLVLGCTHYPLLDSLIRETVGPDVSIINSGLWTAMALQDKLTSLDLLAPAARNGFSESKFFVTDAKDRFLRVSEPFLGQKLPAVEKITLNG